MAGNVIPDRCEVEVNYRFAPDRAEAEACGLPPPGVRGVRRRRYGLGAGRVAGLRGPRPRFLAAVGEPPMGKLGWTDVSRFAAMGVPALNFGPGDRKQYEN